MYNAGMVAMFPQTVGVTDQDIDLSSLSEAQREHYRALATHVVDVYGAHGHERAVIGFAGQSGSGKSVTVEILRALFEEGSPSFRVYTADIDAFHYPNAMLTSVCDEHGVALRTVKGRYDTYDVSALAHALERFVAGEEVMLPRYSRKIHDPVVEGSLVERGPALLLIAGLWLLRDTPEWRAVRHHIAHTFLMEGSHELMREHVILRHMRGGRSRQDAELFYAASDAQNALEIVSRSVDPDEVMPFFENVASI